MARGVAEPDDDGDLAGEEFRGECCPEVSGDAADGFCSTSRSSDDRKVGSSAARRAADVDDSAIGVLSALAGGGRNRGRFS